jgi:hypothetical protein
MRRGNHWLIVNSTPIRSFWTQRKELRREVEKALNDQTIFAGGSMDE